MYMGVGSWDVNYVFCWATNSNPPGLRRRNRNQSLLAVVSSRNAHNTVHLKLIRPVRLRLRLGLRLRFTLK